MTARPIPYEFAPSAVGGKVTAVAHVRDAASTTYADTAASSAVAAIPEASTSVRGEIIADWEQLRRHGCVGDGTTDDSTAFQACLDAVGAYGGGLIRIPPNKVFRVQDLQVRTGTILEGVTKGLSTGSRLILANAGHDVVKLGNTIAHVRIRSLEINGASKGTGSCAMRWAVTADQYYQMNNRFEHATVRGFDQGMVIGDDAAPNASFNNTLVDDVLFLEVGQAFTLNGLNLTAWRISNCGMTGLGGATDYGFFLKRAGFGTIDNCTGAFPGSGTALIRAERIDILNVIQCQQEQSTYFFELLQGDGTPHIIWRSCHFPFPSMFRRDCHLVFDSIQDVPAYPPAAIQFANDAANCQIYVTGHEIPSSRFALTSNNRVRVNGRKVEQSATQPDGYPANSGVTLLATTDPATLLTVTHPVTGLYRIELFCHAFGAATLGVTAAHGNFAGAAQSQVLFSGTTVAGDQSLGSHTMYLHSAENLVITAQAGTAPYMYVSATVTPLG